ncbi:MAG: radical SAM protein [Coprococcus sp.]
MNITIYPTQACNARCFYCFEQKEQKYWMTEETADEVVDYITRTLSVDNELVFRWFGGEPLLGEKIIDRIITGVDDFLRDG